VPAGHVRPAPTRPGDGALGRPVAVEVVPGTQFGLAIVGVAPTTSGPAIASLVAGVGSILVSTVVGCFGVLGAGSGWGPTVSGAFAVLAGLAGLAAIALGLVGRRQIRRSAGWRSVTGKGLAMSGIICGAVGVGLTVLSFVAAIALIIRD
jgi:hypothetical protein